MQGIFFIFFRKSTEISEKLWNFMEISGIDLRNLWILLWFNRIYRIYLSPFTKDIREIEQL
jgi:hypothetical protein